ncbi:hypothetical protein MKX03_005213 [Papaver bracteatum]|nr:hypothetical protein MKX03_005213 [Papaver bracteatum]
MAVTKRKRSDIGGKRKAIQSSNKKKDEKHGGNQLRKRIELLNPKPFYEAGELLVNDDDIPEEESKKNRRRFVNLDHQFPHDLLDENVLSDDDSEQSGVEEGEGNHARMLQRITGMPSEAFGGKTIDKNITITEAYPESEFNPSRDTLDGSGGIGIQDLLEPLRGTAGYNALNKRIGQVEGQSMAIGTTLAKVYKDRIDRKVASVVQDVQVVDAHMKDGARLLELNPISVEDVKDHQNHLAKMCSLLFRHEQKSKHIKKRKCKTYDRLKNKDKLKTFFSAEEMNHDSAKELAFKQEFRRAEEHMTLKHKKKSRWAKRRIRRGLATQDEGTRAAIANQLNQHAILTRKMNTMKDNSSSDDSSDLEVDDDLEAVADQDGPLKLVTRAKEKTLIIIEEEDEAPKSGVLSLPFMFQNESDNDRKNSRVVDPALPHKETKEEDEDSGSESGEEMVDGILTSGTKQDYKLPSQRELIHGAFAGDDVMEEFAKDKLETLNEENPEPEKPTLVPGWGQWTHIQKKKGLPSWMVEDHAIAQKKREDALKERKDSHLKHVIISERLAKKVVTESGVIINPIEYKDVDPYKKSEKHKEKGKTQPKKKKNKLGNGKSVYKLK